MKKHLSSVLSFVLVLSLAVASMPGTGSGFGTAALAQAVAKTRIIDRVVDVSDNPRQGTVTFILTKTTTTPGGIAPAGATVSAVLNSNGYFDVSLYPSEGISPQQYYQVWFADKTTLKRELLGVYAIPASSSTVTLAPYKVTDTALAAQYTFASETAVTNLIEAAATATVASLGPEPIYAALGYTPEDSAKKGQASGYAALDGSGKVPAAQLPPTDAVSIRGTEVENAVPTEGDVITYDAAIGKYAPRPPPAASAATGDLKQGLISYWQMEETSGTRQDSHGTNHLTAPVALGTQGGKVGLAPDFYDVDARRLSVNDNSSLNFTAKSLFISTWVWVPLAPTSTRPGIVTKASNDDPSAATDIDFALYWDRSAGRFRFLVSNGVSVTGVSAAAVTPALNTWYHVAAWYNKTAGGSINIQINGGQVYTAAHAGGVNHTSAPLRIANWNNSQYFTGAIDEVAIWDRVLTPSEREKLYASGNALAYPFVDTSTTVSRSYTYHIKDDFNASGSAETTTGTMSAGSTLLTVTNAKDFKVGQGILVPGAGTLAPTNDLVTTITALNGLNFTLATAATNNAAAVTVQHDETAAVIASINQCYARRGCKTNWPPGDYNIEGPLQGATNSILSLPLNAYPNGTYTLHWQGEFATRIAETTGATKGVNIISKRRTGSGTFPALLAARAYMATSYNEFNFVNVVIENINFRTAPNPTIGVLQLHEATNATLKNLMIDTRSPGDAETPVDPTNAQSVGIILPGRGNRSGIQLENVTVHGLYEGIRFSEQTHFAGNVFVDFAQRAFVKEIGFHGTTGTIGIFASVQGIVVLPGAGGVMNLHVSIETTDPASGLWHVPSSTAFFSDVDSAATGRIEYYYAIAGPGSYGTPSKSGMNNVTLCDLVAGQCKRGAGAAFSF